MNKSWLPALATAACGLLVPTAGHAHREQAQVADVVPATGIPLNAPRPGLYTAGQPAVGDWQAIRARGVGTVIDLRVPGELQGRDEAAEVRAAGMRHVAIPVAGMDGISVANARLLGEAIAAADGPVLVHCASGNRVGGLLAVMLGRIEGVPAAEALEIGRSAGMAGSETRARQLLETGD